MELVVKDPIEAIKGRRTIRAYLPRPVPKEALQEVLEVARYSPSWANTQPWEFAVFGGEVMETIREALENMAAAQTPPNPDIPAPLFTDKLRQRSRENGLLLYRSLGITREDVEKRRRYELLGTRLFEAPNGIVIYMDRSLGPWSVLDIGLVLQSIMIAAHSYGLGTSALYNLIRYPEVLRTYLDIPESKKIVCGLAIGYPDEAAPQNLYERPRAPLEELATWHGFPD
ncbi:MAG: nitroreductase [Chloroflexota bacterium]|nr:nitroreductase [Chloroflexota bacterium]